MEKEKNLAPIYDQVKNAIKSLNLDQQQLAERLGITQAAVSKALNGKSDRSLQRLIALLRDEYGLNLSGEKAFDQQAELEAIRRELWEMRESLEQGLRELREMVEKKL